MASPVKSATAATASTNTAASASTASAASSNNPITEFANKLIDAAFGGVSVTEIRWKSKAQHLPSNAAKQEEHLKKDDENYPESTVAELFKDQEVAKELAALNDAANLTEVWSEAIFLSKNRHPKTKHTILHEVMGHGEDPKWILHAKLILAIAPDLLHTKIIGGWTPLHCAAQAGKLQYVELFVSKLKKLNIADPMNPLSDSNQTPLLLAAMWMRSNVVSYFATHNPAGKEIMNKQGLTPADLAFMNSHRFDIKTGKEDPAEQRAFLLIANLLKPSRGILSMNEIAKKIGIKNMAAK